MKDFLVNMSLVSVSTILGIGIVILGYKTHNPFSVLIGAIIINAVFRYFFKL